MSQRSVGHQQKEVDPGSVTLRVILLIAVFLIFVILLQKCNGIISQVRAKRLAAHLEREGRASKTMGITQSSGRIEVRDYKQIQLPVRSYSKQH